jgi:hypothetical protein
VKSSIVVNLLIKGPGVAYVGPVGCWGLKRNQKKKKKRKRS